MNNVEDTEAPPEEERSSIVENLGQPPENENPTTEKIAPEQSNIIFYCFMNYTLNRSIFLHCIFISKSIPKIFCILYYNSLNYPGYKLIITSININLQKCQNHNS